jgi:phospholipid/cholesterol/gamma-HCH transport system ATP-binding protein
MRKHDGPFIRVKDLTVGYGDGNVIENASFDIDYGDIFVIMGISGCGKSTIMRSIIGLIPPKSGHILVEGADLWALSPDERANIVKTFGISFQSGALFSSMTLGENVALPMEMETQMSRSEIQHRTHEKLELVGLDKYINLYPSEVSGGMLKRAALARAMALNPRILFFDEPSAGLDPIRSVELDGLIREINQTTRTTVVMVTHELSTIMNIATNSVYICDKTVGATGAPQEILANTKNQEIIYFLTRGQRRNKK